jgi:phosphoglycerate dehydrogenase-like enzyme
VTFTLVLLPPALGEWAGRLADSVPGIRVVVPETADETMSALASADAAFGALPPELLRHAGRLRWLQAPRAAPPPDFYHPALIAHPVVVTNMRDTYTDHVATHALALVLGLARGFPAYLKAQGDGRWAPDWDPGSVLALSEADALVIGVGAVGAEIGRLLAAFGTRVIGVDARRTEAPPGFDAMHPVGETESLLPESDLVVLTVPHTPATEGMVDARWLSLCKRQAFFVNVGRGPTVVLDDLVAALKQGQLRGVGLDVFETEPLPKDHPLWTLPNVLLTPHVAGAGPHADERRFAVLLENARRFGAGEPLINVVDKAQRY